MPATLIILLSLALAMMVVGLVILVVAIRNAPEATETEHGLEITREARDIQREMHEAAAEDGSKVQGGNAQFS